MMSRRRKRPIDVGDEGQVEEYKTSVKLNQEREIEELRVILSTYGGRAFMWKMLEFCGDHRTSFVPDPYVTALNEGRRQVGLYLIAEGFTADPEFYTLMRNEAVSRDERDK